LTAGVQHHQLGRRVDPHPHRGLFAESHGERCS
jgi:hypothetical protein